MKKTMTEAEKNKLLREKIQQFLHADPMDVIGDDTILELIDLENEK
ncbi:hypothetical protein ABZU09_06565 [Lactobacillus mulieris]|jgi:transcription factor fapR|uniref:Uncharacterized protein n=2 Tax=root TaxID=1 RepID=A0AAP3GV93_9LACO|nr:MULTISPECIES: hypothetical protein [Lactobacillus]EFH29642.1 hypothetical protein HMPREF0526_11245 [Lactobacillus jensenii JV-V16]EQM96008.1 hypothetical protein HMPREF0525_01502 [Lactobacillus jensenii 27-2-CHN]QGR95271.1 hypothetical protein FOC57_00170 [Lactobacillus jensenii]DAD80340.1 MAG TPA: YhdB-like protein [Siphoviridae sp. ctX581]DAX31941.1 MAG TPA: YhdB-like protein [Caudoviricetes sp.]